MAFRVFPRPAGFELVSNIGFEAADAAYRLHTGITERTLTGPYLLSQIADTRRDLIVGSQFGSEFALAPAQALVASCKFARVLTAAKSGLRAADVFQEEMIEDLPSIKDAVNTALRTLVM